MQRRLGLDLEIPDDFGHWLAGFTDGEGCFEANLHLRKDGYRVLHTRYTLVLRADDVAILKQIQSILTVGRIELSRRVGRETTKRKPQARYVVNRIADLYHVIVPLFEEYALRAKKARVFEIWKELVEAQYHEGGFHGRGSAPGGKSLGMASLPQSYWDKIEPLVEQLKKERQFNG